MPPADDLPPGDPHAELGVPRGASEHEVKTAWRRLAARWHPDRNPHPRAAERMKRINEAYRQLVAGADADVPAASAEPPEPPARPRRAWWERDWGGARWQADGAATPANVVLDVTLDLEQAAFGCTHAVKGSVADLCAACEGVGRLVSRHSDCDVCDGEGRVRGANGERWTTCPACSGDGDLRRRCDACDGSGRQTAPRRYHFDVRVPPGVRDGQSVMLRGQGQRGANDARGDLELRVALAPHALFSFDAEQRLMVRLPVDAYAVAGGGGAQVPLLGGGTATIDLARGARQVLDGLGYPNRDGSRGALVVETHAVVPAVRSERQRQLLRELADDLRAGGYAGCDELAEWQEKLARRGGDGG